MKPSTELPLWIDRGARQLGRIERPRLRCRCCALPMGFSHPSRLCPVCRTPSGNTDICLCGTFLAR